MNPIMIRLFVMSFSIVLGQSVAKAQTDWSKEHDREYKIMVRGFQSIPLERITKKFDINDQIFIGETVPTKTFAKFDRYIGAYSIFFGTPKRQRTIFEINPFAQRVFIETKTPGDIYEGKVVVQLQVDAQIIQTVQFNEQQGSDKIKIAANKEDRGLEDPNSSKQHRWTINIDVPASVLDQAKAVKEDIESKAGSKKIAVITLRLYILRPQYRRKAKTKTTS